MKRLFLGLLLLTAISATAQTINANKTRQLLLHHLEQDTFRVNRLIDLTNTLSAGEDEKNSSASEALAISGKINYPLGQTLALLYLGTTSSTKGDNVKSLNPVS